MVFYKTNSREMVIIVDWNFPFSFRNRKNPNGNFYRDEIEMKRSLQLLLFSLFVCDVRGFNSIGHKRRKTAAQPVVHIARAAVAIQANVLL